MPEPGNGPFQNPAVNTVHGFLTRYQPFIITVIAIALIAAFLPGRGGDSGQSSDLTGDFGSDVAAGGLEDLGDDDSTGGGFETGATDSIGADPGSGGVFNEAPVLTVDEARKQGVKLVSNCDSKLGRITVPSRFAPPCVPAYSGANAGNTWQGVTKDKIVVTRYVGEGSPAADAILAAAGSDDSDEEVDQQYEDWFTYYQAHYNLWGRKVELKRLDASGPSDDDKAAKADAIEIATQHKAFAALNAPNNTFVDELVARGVMCMCTVSQPIEAYQRWSPYIWSTLMASSQGYIHRAEYIGKRIAGKNAIWAGDATFQLQERKFGLLYYETPDNAYRAGAVFFEKHLRDKYGVKLAANLAYNGYPQIEKTQEQAQPLIQKLKSAGVNAVVFAGDPFGPIFFTQEATRQNYFPEWIVTGSALTDTNFFARTYDPTQWSNAHGISFLSVPLPEDQGESMRLLKWHFGQDYEPPAESGFAVIRAPIHLLFSGLHMAGPTLTPKTFGQGMNALPIMGKGGITAPAQAFGDKGIWPWKVDPLQFDDVTSLWWDPQAQDPEEQDEIGMYRYMAMGKRYLPTQHPTTLPPAFDTKNTVMLYQKPPKQDQWPTYPSPAKK